VDLDGFRARNLKYMRAFAEAYPDQEFVQQVVAQLPWGHQVRILDSVKDAKQREWYIRQVVQGGWSESTTRGQEARNALHLQLLENKEMDDPLSGLKLLRALPYVDARNVAAIGHSFGGSLTVLLAEREPNLRAVVVFSGAGYSFDRSPDLRARLLAAIDHVAAPVFFIHSENYSLSSGTVLDTRCEHIGKSHRLKIYPPIGHTVDDGHDFLHSRRSTFGSPTCLLF
jgi:dienelactone hydrolase